MRLEVTMKKEYGLENITLRVFDVVHVILKAKSPTEFVVQFNPHKAVIKNKKTSRQNKTNRF